MKKKILALCLVVVLAVTAVTGATLAYFTDKDADVNVMTTGNIKIVQNETKRDGSAYEDGLPLLPAVYLDANGNPYNPKNTIEGPGAYTGYTGPDGDNMNMYDTRIENEIDKVVSVTNKGNVPAYIRTIFLLENNGGAVEDNKLHLNWNKQMPDKTERVTVTVDGVEGTYEVWVYTYADALAAGATSRASLKQVWLDPTVDSDWYKLLGEDEKLTIIALSQAAQTTGFDSAEEALNTAFGEVTGANLTKWVAETNIKTSGLNNVVGGALDSATTNP